MASLIGLVALVAVLVWLLGPARRRRTPAPEDDVASPVDQAELEEAEAGLRDDPRARPVEDGFDDDEDDWGPGTGVR